MKTRTAPAARPTHHAFRHEALLYQGTPGFLDSVLPFIQRGVEGGETVLVAVDSAKIDLLRGRLDGVGDQVLFVDMVELGQNPGRIIPAWRDFVTEHTVGGRTVRGVGEPVWAGRTGAELAECHLHESLLNVAFDRGPAWRLTCPYDTEALEPEVVEEARRTHPFVRAGASSGTSRTYPGSVPNGFDRPFAEPAGPVEWTWFDTPSLSDLRDLVSWRGREAGLSPARTRELTMAVNELATNSVRYGGGRGTFGLWREPGTLVVEVRDAGVIRDPLVGRSTPAADQEGGRGLWLVNQFCDLVQVRSLRDGVRVRLHMALPSGRP